MAFWIPAAMIASSLIGAASSKSAGDKAAKAAQSAANASNDLQYRMFQESNQLNEPWRNAGMAALNQRNALLGIGGGTSAGGTGPAAGSTDWNAYLQANPDVAAWAQTAANQPHFTKGAGNAADTNRDGTLSPQEMAAYHYQQYGQGEGRQLPTVAGPTGADGQPLTQSQITDNAYNTFLDSGYARSMLETTNNDFQQMVGAFGAGGKALSGSAIGALNDRNRRNTNNAFTQYDNALAGISNTGSAMSMNQGQQGMNLAQNIGANNMNAANARGSSYMNAANALNSGLQNTTNVLAYGAGNGWFGSGSKMPTLGNEVVNGKMVGGWG